jgi:hypothetical protein
VVARIQIGQQNDAAGEHPKDGQRAAGIVLRNQRTELLNSAFDLVFSNQRPHRQSP